MSVCSYKVYHEKSISFAKNIIHLVFGGIKEQSITCQSEAQKIPGESEGI